MNIVLYHRNCTDGFMSAFLMYLYFKATDQKVELISVNYNEKILDVTDCHVFIVDFSYKPEDIYLMAEHAKSITMLDHHKTAAEQWNGYIDNYLIDYKGCLIDITVRENNSGAGLVYEYISKLNKKSESEKVTKLLNNERLSRAVKCVEDRDLWNFIYPNTPIIYEMLKMVPETFEDWEYVFIYEIDRAYEVRFNKAFNYYEVKENLAQLYASKHQFIEFQGFTIPIVNCPANFTNRVGEILNQDHPFSFMYSLSTTLVYCSMRSRKDGGEDVSEIAKRFNGGGHINSAGFGIKPEQLPLLLSGKM